MEDSCEYDNEPSGSIKCDILERLCEENSVVWSYVESVMPPADLTMQELRDMYGHVLSPSRRRA
jgi:hypothetical protein